MKAAREEMVPSTLSPAEMLPKRRNENERNLVSSDTISSSPTNRSRGLSVKKRFRYAAIPVERMASTCVAITETTARASVVFRSEVLACRRGTSRPARKNPIVPNPGRSPRRFEKRM